MEDANNKKGLRNKMFKGFKVCNRGPTFKILTERRENCICIQEDISLKESLGFSLGYLHIVFPFVFDWLIRHVVDLRKEVSSK